MPGRALLIGAGYRDLRGAENDVAAMAAALERYEFRSERCVGAGADRDSILGAYERLIDEAQPGEPVVVFFSGHGGYARAPEVDGFDIQYIVPNDYDPSGADGIRCITSVELSSLQARLVAKTKNVTVVLDCCHAGRMARDPRQLTKAVPGAGYSLLRAHLDRLRAAGLNVEEWRNEGNPYVVRVVACAPRQLAFERRRSDDTSIGLLTESLVKALNEAGDQKVTWAAVMARVRTRIAGLDYDQRPDVEGPVNRRLFELGEADLLMSLPVAPLDDSGRVRLDCAPLLGVQRGDRFMVMPAGASGPDARRRIGDLTVEGVDALSAEGRVVFPGTARATDLTGARAFRTEVQAPRIRVRVPVDHPLAADVIAAFDAGSLAEVAAPDEDDWSAEVGIGVDGSLTLGDRIGALHEPYPGDRAGVEQLGRDLKIFAQATQLRRLVGSPRCALSADVDIEWGRVVDGKPQPSRPDDVVHTGDRIYVRVRNDSPETVYVSMVDIGVSGKITLLTRGAPGGWEVDRHASYTLGEDRLTGDLDGSLVTWPHGVDPRQGRPETILVFVTSDHQDLRALEQPAIGRFRARGAGISPLQDMIDQLATGNSRDATAESAPAAMPVRYDVYAITFDVVTRH